MENQIKLYAGQVKHVNRSMTTKDGKNQGPICLLVQVYGWYDQKDPGTLHQREAVMTNVWISRKSPLANAFAVKDRIVLPAAGISMEGRKSKTSDLVTYDMVSLEVANIVCLNKQEMQNDDAAYTKSGTSMVMVAASDSVLSKLGRFIRALV